MTMHKDYISKYANYSKIHKAEDLKHNHIEQYFLNLSLLIMLMQLPIALYKTTQMTTRKPFKDGNIKAWLKYLTQLRFSYFEVLLLEEWNL
jgi:hypothetical protein